MISILYYFSLCLPFLFFPLTTYEPFEFPKAIALIFFITSFILYYKPSIIYYGYKNCKLNPIRTLVITFVFLSGVGSLLGSNIFQSLVGQYYRYQGFLTLLALFGTFLLIANGRALQIDYRTLFRFIAVSAVGVCVLVIVQGAVYFLFKTSIFVFFGRMTATLGNPNFTGAYLTMCFPFAYLLLGSKSVTKAVIIFLFGIAILLTQSRGSMGVFLFIVVLMALPYRHFPLVLFGSITIGAVLIFGILYRQPSLFDNRLLIWQRGIEAFRQKPIFGWGLENFDAAFQSTLSNKPYDYDLREIRVDKAHNEFIEVAVASGIFSLITYISLLIVSLRTLLRRRDQLLVRMSLFSFVAFIFLSSVNVVSISAYYVFYIILGYASHTHDNPNDMYIERHSAKN